MRELEITRGQQQQDFVMTMFVADNSPMDPTMFGAGVRRAARLRTLARARSARVS